MLLIFIAWTLRSSASTLIAQVNPCNLFLIRMPCFVGYQILVNADDEEFQEVMSPALLDCLPSFPLTSSQLGDATDPRSTECVVCLEQLSAGDLVRVLPCFHKFHTACVDKWLRKKATCPICSFNVTRAFSQDLA
eukprot:c13005_g1_i1.p1 GENE.c13005_g1_i1~~c13005_g1_i1.p1  ORF type:complete len:135 (+),score=13.50 c13005_g1_i1:223-627(+)